jgi:excinuclease ABC subunit C
MPAASHPVTPEILGSLPTGPGVYLFRDSKGEILYVGKAKSLRPRVRSYFRNEASLTLKTRELVRRVATLDTIVVGSEAEALILEANLIKEHQPRFNIHLRDDKRYPYLKVTVQEAFPRVMVTREVRDDGARYFGPYTAVGPLRQALEVVTRLYTVRSCRYDLPREAPDRPCLDHHIGRCLAPCVGLQSQGSYGDMVREILRILDGDTASLREEVEGRMRTAAQELRFEEAARLRDVTRGLDAMARQQLVHKVGGGDRDILALARDGELATAVVLRIRRGLLLGRESLQFAEVGDEGEDALLYASATRYYLGRGEEGTRDLPREVLVPRDFPDRLVLEGILSERAGRKLKVRVPLRGEGRRILELAATNARSAMEDRIASRSLATNRADEILYELQDRLDLNVVPRVMVCFDVSHLQGTDTVASAVVFENGAPRKSGYRHMKIRGEWGNDDLRSMGEALTRFFRRRLDEGTPLPDLVVLDGGRGQLHAARTALGALGLKDVAVVALAKREEEIHLWEREHPVSLPRKNEALRLLQRIRDEAHRFANSYNRKLRSRRSLTSRLDGIPGVGPARREALVKHFGSVRALEAAGPQEIARLPGFGLELAQRICRALGDPTL